MFGLTKREQRWKAEQKAAETIAGVLVAAVNAKSHRGEEMNKSEQLIACLEGEIAKRDEELAACRVAVENCELFRARIAELEADRDSHQRCAIQAMVELAAIKAQGVVMPRNIEKSFLEWASAQLKSPTQLAAYMAGADEVASLNAAPAQQVSVPDVSAMARILADRNADACNVNREDNWMIYGQDYIDDVTAMLAAAPAPTAADAGLVEALELAANRLDRLALEQGEFWRGYATAWADEARATANGVKS